MITQSAVGGRQQAAGSGETAQDTVVVVDFGSQTAQLIVRRVRELHVYSELVPHDAPWERIQPTAYRSCGTSSTSAAAAPEAGRAQTSSSKRSPISAPRSASMAECSARSPAASIPPSPPCSSTGQSAID